jgi:3-deoxy-D-manno-octulosonic-acid transferase
MFFAYEVLLYLVFTLLLPIFLITGLIRGKYLSNFPERLGVYRTPAQSHDLWLHAVSVGETIAARPVMAAIERMRPQTSVVITTTTVTGQTQAKELFPNATVTYFPFDFSFSVRRFLDHHHPRAFATMETEIWPNVLRIAKSRGIRLLLANGRLSDRSFPRYRFARPLLRRVLRFYDRILAREELDRERFIAVGAPQEIVEASGNVKFDYQPDESPLAIASQLESLIGGRPVFVLGSLLEGEDEMFVPLLGELKDVFVILAPRKPDRFEAVAGMLSNLQFVRRTALSKDPSPPRAGEKVPQADAGDGFSNHAAPHPPAAPSPHFAGRGVLLLDTIGELARIYRYATVAFVGGSLIPAGGHNPIEPAAAGVPVCFGPSMSNFREIATVLLRDGAAKEVATAKEAIHFARQMIAGQSARKAMGDRARQTVAENRGASERTARRIVELLA